MQSIHKLTQQDKTDWKLYGGCTLRIKLHRWRNLLDQFQHFQIVYSSKYVNIEQRLSIPL